MRSGTSCFNKSYSLHLLRRFWPLWVLWLTFLLLLGPALLASAPPESFEDAVRYLSSLDRSILESGRILAFLAFFMGPAMAMAMLSHLYNPRACFAVGALPMKRETVYCTAVLTGLVPLLLADALVFLLMLAHYTRLGADAACLLSWLAMTALTNTAFFGMACFCGLLTGSVLILPAVYVLLGCAAAIVEATVRSLLGALVYGYSWEKLLFSGLSPVLHMTDGLVVRASYPGGLADAAAGLRPVYRMQGLGYLAAIAAAGLGLAALGILLLRRRHMETAGEIVAVPILRPVFRVCMAIGCALVGTAIANEALLSVLLHGRALAAALAVTLCVCAFVGFFAAQMLMKKTLRVFRDGWKQLGAICACLVLLLVLAEADVVGYETRVPEEGAVASVTLNNSTLRDSASIAAVCDTHRALIANKARDEGAGQRRSNTLSIDYTLKNGKHFTRRYRVPTDEALEGDPGSSIMAWQALSNCPEAILGRAVGNRPVTAEKIRCAYVSVRRPADDPKRGWTGEDLYLTPAEAESLWREGVLPDAEAGNIARWYAFSGEEARREETNVSLVLEREEEPVPTPDGLSYYYDADAYLFLDVLESSVNTRAWLAQKLGVTAENQYELEQRSESLYKK